jgi:hypothetical protein
MKLTKHLLGPLTISLAVAALGCSGAKLDGGSNDNTSGGGSGAGSSGVTPIADQPAQGTIDGHDFVVKSVDLQFSKAQNQWFLTFRNYSSVCGDLPGGIPGDALLINIGAVEQRAGDATIAYADGHGAAFQVGLGSSTTKTDATPIQQGTLHLDSWSDTAGATITGKLRASNATSDVEGTFTANVCAPH